MKMERQRPLQIRLDNTKEGGEAEEVCDSVFLHAPCSVVCGGLPPPPPFFWEACTLKFSLRDFTSCLCSAAALAVCFKGLVAGVGGVDATETGNEFSQLKF